MSCLVKLTFMLEVNRRTGVAPIGRTYVHHRADGFTRGLSQAAGVSLYCLASGRRKHRVFRQKLWIQRGGNMLSGQFQSFAPASASTAAPLDPNAFLASGRRLREGIGCSGIVLSEDVVSGAEQIR
jgi:hypothetical protein